MALKETDDINNNAYDSEVVENDEDFVSDDRTGTTVRKRLGKDCAITAKRHNVGDTTTKLGAQVSEP